MPENPKVLHIRVPRAIMVNSWIHLFCVSEDVPAFSHFFDHAHKIIRNLSNTSLYDAFYSSISETQFSN